MAGKEFNPREQLIKNGLLLLAVAILIIACFDVILPFMGIFVYAIIIAAAMWSPFAWLSTSFGGRRKPAAAVFALAFLLLLAGPFAYLASTLGTYYHSGSEIVQSLMTNGLPPAPAWVATLPFFGPEVQARWELFRTDTTHQLSLYEPQLSSLAKWLLSVLAGLLGATVELVLGIILAAFILMEGDQIKTPLHRIADRLFGSKGAPAILSAAHRAVKGVAVGVLGTSLLGGILAWVGFSLAGLSSAVALAGLLFFMMMMQLGPVLLLIPVIAWLFIQGQNGSAIFVAIYGIVVLMTVDNIIKPWLIARTGKLPIFVLLIGVIGGMAAWGFTGMFIGAIALSVFYTVLQTWIAVDPEETKEIEIPEN